MVRFTRQDFRFIADTLKQLEPERPQPYNPIQDGAYQQWEKTIELFIRHLKSTNSRFKEDVFTARAKG